MAEKIALFDFCETLANFQTADAYVKYVCENVSSPSIVRKQRIHSWLYRHQVVRLVNRFFPRLYFNKRLFLWRLKGLKEEMLNNLAKGYYDNVVKPNLISEVIDILREKQNDGYTIYIVSAGYEIYLNYFAEDYDIPRKNIISDKIAFNNGICQGRLLDGEIMFKKTKELDRIIDKSHTYSEAYSDSMTDLPLLQWANKGVVIRQIDKSWAHDYGFDEILWRRWKD